MPQSLSNVTIHIIFGTRRRAPLLSEAPVRQRLHAYMAGVLQQLDSPAITINGTEDHVHVLCVLSRRQTISGLVEEIKTTTSKWIKRESPRYHDFYWQRGYGVFSVSQSMIPALQRYIANQHEHHRKTRYEDEFREICKLHRVAIDERYVWD